MANHLLGDYLHSFVSVLLAQFSRKRFPGGMDGVVRLAERSPTIQARACMLLPDQARLFQGDCSALPFATLL